MLALLAVLFPANASIPREAASFAVTPQFSRILSNGSQQTQTLTWDGAGRLTAVSQRDQTTNNGYDWTALYDGLGRRLRTVYTPVDGGVSCTKLAVTQESWYDPEVEFLELGVSVNGQKHWKMYGPDLDGAYGGLQGIGGLEAVIDQSDGVATPVVNDAFGNAVASVTNSTVVVWNPTRVGGYGPLPGSSAQWLSTNTTLATATVWRGKRMDPTGYYWMGARYYDPVGGRFLSPDPLGHEASMDLYSYANGDPINGCDPDGRCVEKVKTIAWEFTGSAAAGFLQIENPVTHFWDPFAFEPPSTASYYGQKAGHYAGAVFSAAELNAGLMAFVGGGVVDVGAGVGTAGTGGSAMPVAAPVAVVATGVAVVGAVATIHGGTGLFNFYELEMHKTGGSGSQSSTLQNATPKSVKPPSLTPQGAGRTGALREALRRNGVPTSQQPRVLPNVDKRGNVRPGRIYEYDVPAPGGGTRTVRIRDDTAGHNYGSGNSQNRGPHFNDEAGNHYDY